MVKLQLGLILLFMWNSSHAKNSVPRIESAKVMCTSDLGQIGPEDETVECVVIILLNLGSSTDLVVKDQCRYLPLYMSGYFYP